MLCSSKIHPHILAYDSLNGTFNFDKTLFAPQGTKVIMHEKPMTRRSFAPSGIDSWYVASVFHHFCCQQIYIPKMRGFCIGDTVDFFPYNTTLTPKTVQEQILEQTKALIRLYMQQPSKPLRAIEHSIEVIVDTPSPMPIMAKKNKLKRTKNLTSVTTSTSTICVLSLKRSTI